MRHIIFRILSLLLLVLFVSLSLMTLRDIWSRETDLLHIVGIGAILYYLSGAFVALGLYAFKGAKYKPKSKLIASFFEPVLGGNVTVYIQLWNNRIKATCKELNSTVEDKASVNQEYDADTIKLFKHPRVLLSDIPLTEAYLKSVIKHLFENDKSNRS